MDTIEESTTELEGKETEMKQPTSPTSPPPAKFAIKVCMAVVTELGFIVLYQNSNGQFYFPHLYLRFGQSMEDAAKYMVESELGAELQSSMILHKQERTTDDEGYKIDELSVGFFMQTKGLLVPRNIASYRIVPFPHLEPALMVEGYDQEFAGHVKGALEHHEAKMAQARHAQAIMAEIVPAIQAYNAAQTMGEKKQIHADARERVSGIATPEEMAQLDRMFAPLDPPPPQQE